MVLDYHTTLIDWVSYFSSESLRLDLRLCDCSLDGCLCLCARLRRLQSVFLMRETAAFFGAVFDTGQPPHVCCQLPVAVLCIMCVCVVWFVWFCCCVFLAFRCLCLWVQQSVTVSL